MSWHTYLSHSCGTDDAINRARNLNYLPDQIVLWRRYLNNIIAIIPENSTNRLLIHLNSLYQSSHQIHCRGRMRQKIAVPIDLITRKKDTIIYPTQSTGRTRIPATT